MATQEQWITSENVHEVMAKLGPSDKRYEVVNGVLVEMSPSGDRAAITALWFGALILGYVEAHDLGEVTGADGGYELSLTPYIVRAPDVAFVAKERLTGPMDGKYYHFAPDLAVEVVSPQDTAREVHDKVLEYLRFGVRLIWVVYPESRTIDVHQAAGAHTLKIDDELTGGDVLPSFRVPVRDVFKKIRD
ncbi:MAG TPA: Uma2 family endonuclease [Aggregatilineales bacterium]|nr:Uma2 family endonuclease [Aggregatilineales bacterium]